MEKNMKIYEELQARGLLAQLTDPAEIRDLVNDGKATFSALILPLIPCM